MASETREPTVEERIAALHSMAISPAAQWWLYRRELPTGLVLFVIEVFQGFRIGLGKSDSAVDGFCTVIDYSDVQACWRTALGWNGEGDPEGWVRLVQFGGGGVARRRPDGTPESEYSAP